MNYIGPGSVLNNRYVVGDCIGVGGMAVVFKGVDRTTDTEVALKVLKPEFTAVEQNVTRFKKEAESAYRLNHPNIVKIYGIGCCSGVHYIAMQYIDGITLTEYMEKCGVFNWKNAFEIIRQVLSALAFAHEEGVVHRDIKPQNILVDENMHVTLTDFGIAQDSINSNTIDANTNACSVHYLSPEQARGTFADGRTDIYSTGITLYEMIVGSVPFDGDSAVSVALKHLQGRIMPPVEVDSSIPKGVSDVVMMATMRDTGKRFQSADEMLAQMRIVSENPDISFWKENTVASEPVKKIPAVTTDDTSSEDNFDDEDDVKTFVIGGRSRTEVSAEPGADESEDIPASEETEEDVGAGETTDTEETEEEVSSDEENSDDGYVSPGKRGVRIAGKVITYVVAGILAIATIIFAVSMYKSISPEPGVVYKIKKYEGYKAVDVIEALDKLGIIVVQKETTETDGYPSGYIISQDISADTLLSAGDTITFTVAVEEGYTIVDNCSGMDPRQADDVLSKKGLVTEIKYIPGKNMVNGTVIRTTPEAGAPVKTGETVVLYVCKGDVCPVVTVPNLSGMTYEQARNTLKAAGLNLGGCFPNPGEDISELLATPTPEPTETPVVTETPEPTETPDVETMAPPFETEKPFETEGPSDIPVVEQTEIVGQQTELPSETILPSETELPENIPEALLENRDIDTSDIPWWGTFVPEQTATAEPSLVPELSFTPEPTATPEPIFASDKVVAQYPKAGETVYKGSSVTLYFYDKDALNNAEEKVSQTLELPEKYKDSNKITVMIEYVLADGSKPDMEIFTAASSEFPLTFDVPFSAGSDTTEVVIKINDTSVVYEKRIVKKP